MVNIVTKLATKEKVVYDFILINYLDKEAGEKELFEVAIQDLDLNFQKRYKGYADELKAKNMLTACVKRINEFTKISKNNVLEADLLIYILNEAFSYGDSMFGTCFEQFDNKVAIILKRLINILTKKLHEDHLADYREDVNQYLSILHKKSSHLQTVYQLPLSI